MRGADRETLAKWRKSNDKGLWQKAVAILENWSLSLEEIARKIEKSPSQIRCWIKAYNRQGLRRTYSEETRDKQYARHKGRAEAQTHP